MNRRQSLKTIANGFGAATLGASITPSFAQAASSLSAFSARSGGPKRVVFFLQNHGFDPKTCVPTNMVNSGSLASAELPEPIKALQPIREKIHIINGLHGRHTSAMHSAFFGALGGYRGGTGIAPGASTIDHELSKVLPESILSHLCIGMDSMADMTARPTLAKLSARGPGQPIFMYSNPNHLYELLYGGISEGEIFKQYKANSLLLEHAEQLAVSKGKTLPLSQQQRFGEFTQGFNEMNALRERLGDVSEHLKQFAPKVDARYTSPEFETDWHDATFELGLSALKSGMTNVLTIGSGRGDIFGSWNGLEIATRGHGLGHMDQPDNPIWVKIRQYNMQMILKMVEELENVPEGSGSMMDNTLIVYTSNNADKQHTKAPTWPMILIGNGGGAFQTGKFTQYQDDQPINALYASILKTAGVHVDRFNMTNKMAAKYDSGIGPLKEVIA